MSLTREERQRTPGMLRRGKITRLARRAVEAQAAEICERLGLRLVLDGAHSPLARQVTLRVLLGDAPPEKAYGREHPRKSVLNIAVPLAREEGQRILDGLEALLVAFRAIHHANLRAIVEPTTYFPERFR